MQIDYCLTINFKSEEYIYQHKTLLWDFKKKKVKDTKLHEVSFRSDFTTYVKDFKVKSETDTSVETYCKLLKGTLQEAIEITYGQTKDPARHREMQ